MSVWFGSAQSQGQRRLYLNYFLCCLNPPLHTPPHTEPSFIVRLYNTKIHDSEPYTHFKKTDSFAEMCLPQPLPVCGDIRIEFYSHSWSKKEKIFQFWFNTFFVDMHVMQQQAEHLEDSM